MKKQIIIGTVLTVFIIGTIVGYHNINQLFPEREIKKVEKGTKIEFKDDIDIAVKNIKWMPEEEKKIAYGQMGVDSENLNYDMEIALVTLSLSNNTDEEVMVQMTDLYLEGVGIGNGISKDIISIKPEQYGSLNEVLNPGETKEVTYPYELLSLWFHDKDWRKVKDKEFWLTFSAYPERTVLYLQ